MLGPIISETYTDDVILDEVPPVVQSAALVPVGTGKAAIATATRKYVIRVRAKDSNSGVGKVQVASNKRRPAKAIAYRPKVTVNLGSKPKFIRAQDRAGNYSAWKALR